MAGLTGKKIAAAYKSLLRIDDDTNGLDTSTAIVTDGEGTSSCLYLSDDQLVIIPANDDTTATFRVSTKGGTALFTVDTTNSTVSGPNGKDINTQYAYFGINYQDFSHIAADTHYSIPFGGANGGATSTNDVDFGTGTDPDDTFTTADTDTQYASQIVPMMWLLPDNIEIDSVSSIEGADAATGDTTRMHLKSFTFNSGSTSCLTSGTLLAHNNDITGAGNEQAYSGTWTVDSASVSSGKVILAFFRSDSAVNSDYSLSVVIKYHLV